MKYQPKKFSKKDLAGNNLASVNRRKFHIEEPVL